MRTQLAKPTQSPFFPYKWRVKFETFQGPVGDEHLAGETASSHLFASEDEAYAAGDRALNTLMMTGKYPNMCEPW
jgi:hypothetical protein